MKHPGRYSLGSAGTDPGEQPAQGCIIRYGTAPDELYMSWLVYDVDEVKLSTIISNQPYYICVDSFNENGVTTGTVFQL